MALKAGYKGIKKVGPGLKMDSTNGILELEGESTLDLDDLADVEITEPDGGDILIYSDIDDEWFNTSPATSPAEGSTTPISSGGVYNEFIIGTESTATPGTGITFETGKNRVIKKGKIVELFLHITEMPDPSLGRVTVGTVPYKPEVEFYWFDFLKDDVPWTLRAKGFIRGVNGDIIIDSDLALAGVTSGYIQGIYITRD